MNRRASKPPSVVPIRGSESRTAAHQSTPPTRGTREFSQRRARETYEALLSAAETVFSELGYDATQTTDIARAAGVAVGTYYRYFADKRQALLELLAHHLEQSHAVIADGLTLDAFGEGRSPEEKRDAADSLLNILFQDVSARPNLHRMFVTMSHRDIDVARLRRSYEERARKAVASLLREVVDARRIPDPDAAATVIQITAEEIMLHSALVVAETDVVDAERARRLRTALSDMLYRYLFAQ